jgi:hypothetical protein
MLPVSGVMDQNRTDDVPGNAVGSIAGPKKLIPSDVMWAFDQILPKDKTRWAWCDLDRYEDTKSTSQFLAIVGKAFAASDVGLIAPPWSASRVSSTNALRAGSDARHATAGRCWLIRCTTCRVGCGSSWGSWRADATISIPRTTSRS